MPNNIDSFRLSRKQAKIVAKTKYIPTRYIDRVEYIGDQEAQCIMIDDPDHLYITDNFIVTHNTLLAIAAAFELILNKHEYAKLIVMRPPIPMGKDIGYLPGSLEEKMAVWAGPVYDSLDFLLTNANKKFNVDYLINNDILEIAPPTFIRGRSLTNCILIIDEAQGLTQHEMKTIVTRMGAKSKLIITGDVYQIDNHQLSSVDNGFSHLVDKFRAEPLSAHMMLTKCERSDLAARAAELL